MAIINWNRKRAGVTASQHLTRPGGWRDNTNATPPSSSRHDGEVTRLGLVVSPDNAQAGYPL